MTKKNLKLLTKSTIERIGPCESVYKEHPEDVEFFESLYTRHPKYPEKCFGLDDLAIRPNPKTGDLEGILKKKDGSEDNISLLNQCITGNPKNNLYYAHRTSIHSQILEYRNMSEHVCEFCGSVDKLEVDHIDPQFIDIQMNFIELNTYNPSEFDETSWHCKIFRKEDSDYENSWYKFHKKHAILRMLCKMCNTSRKKSSINTHRKPKIK